TRQRLACLGLQRDGVAVTKHETAESVPFRFVLPPPPGRDGIDRLRFHWRNWGLEGHARLTSPSTQMAGFLSRPLGTKFREPSGGRCRDPLLQLLLRRG